MKSDTLQKQLGNGGEGALRIAGLYLLVGILWILFSDQVVATITSDPAILTQLSIYKGWGFIIVTALMLYLLIRAHSRALRQSEERLLTLTNALPVLISYVGKDKRYLFANQEYEEWFGHQAAGREVVDVVGKTAYQRLEPYIDAALQGKQVFYETQVDLQNAGPRFIQATYVPDYGNNGKVKGLFALVQDVSERKSQEQELRQWADAFEHCAHGIALADPNSNRIVICNSAFALLHKARVEDVVGLSILSLYAPSHHDPIRHHVARADQIGHAQYEAEMIRRDGSTFPVQTDIVSVRGDDGELLYRVATAQDITQRKEAERALAQQSNIIHFINDAVIVADSQLIVRDWNSAAERMYGWSREEVIGRTGESVLRTEFFNTTREQTVQQLRDRGEFSAEITQLRKDGTRIFVETRTVALSDAQGGFAQLICVNRDITERIQADKNLQWANRQLNDILESIKDDFYVLDRDWNFVYASRQLAAKVGKEPAEFVGKNLWTMFPNYVGTALEENFREAMEKREIRRFEVPGSYTSAWYKMTAFPSQDGITVLGTDITELKQAEGNVIENEARYHRVLDAMMEGCQIIGFDWKYVYVNDVVAAQGRRKPEELLGHTMMEMYPGIENTELFLALRECMEQRTIRRLETQFVFPDGAVGWFELSIQPAREGIFILSTEITERKRAEDKVRQLNEKLEERVIERTAQLHAANKELEAFSYSVSHDLRAPLRAISGYTRILVEDYLPQLDEEGARICNVITDQARRMGELIDDLLSFSRLSRKEMQTARVDMKALATSVYSELTTEEQRARIEFSVGRLPPAIADPALLHQVWINLVSNAIKFTSRQERSVIEVGTKRSEDELVYYIRDNGAGFDIRYVDKLFGVFQRLHSQDEFEGTGVGLAIVQRIVQRHAGRVWAEGEVNKGATFYFSLPRGNNHE